MEKAVSAGEDAEEDGEGVQGVWDGGEGAEEDGDGAQGACGGGEGWKVKDQDGVGEGAVSVRSAQQIATGSKDNSKSINSTSSISMKGMQSTLQ